MRTVRSAAWSRNRPRRRVAWLLLVILLVLIALVARVDAALGSTPIDLAIGDADARSGARPAGALDEEADEEVDEEVDEEAEARAAGRVEFDDGAPASLGLDGGDADALAGLVLAGEDDAAPASLALGEDDAAGSAGPGALTMLDAELAPGDATAGLDAADAGATAGAQEIYEQWMRHQRPSPWGRLDVGVSWRRRWSAPMFTPAHRHDEIWLVATWRR